MLMHKKNANRKYNENNLITERKPKHAKRRARENQQTTTNSNGV